ncbi:uncharacterized protein E0L32_012038 [Thyridium curvatum]|uniref:Cytochrome c oxidase subunit 6, mitochondrial n=1 Tax=Thyridium curvatum TaxID=1093900 RepID=A0A507BJT4_9PEZI|nr:uncharacterized protein E0L32_012038 [Thyridium curvatum]TPX17659.1 hypothetical protein E0L32_012038 [Thyridium curvatum]
MSASLLRVAARGPATTFFRANTLRAAQPMTARAAMVLPIVAAPSFSTSARLRSDHGEETFEEFSARYDTQSVHPSHHGLISPSTTLDPPLEPVATLNGQHDLWYEKEFDSVQDVFELQAVLEMIKERPIGLTSMCHQPQRNLNNAFAYDLVPSPSVLIAALKAARRVNDYPTAVRVFEGIKAKVENKGQYEQYLQELKPMREELGILLKEELFPEEQQ